MELQGMFCHMRRVPAVTKSSGVNLITRVTHTHIHVDTQNFSLQVHMANFCTCQSLKDSAQHKACKYCVYICV